MHYLGKNLRHLRKQSSKTQSEIASLIQKGQTTIGNWENGISEPSLNELLIISNFFDISVDTLLKVDLAETHTPISRLTGINRTYSLNEKELPKSEDPFAFFYNELREIKHRMDQMDARLPK
jgi:transcriptional regulator with XRE-family HTH domain